MLIVGIIGYGTMGSAIARGIINDRYDVRVFDADPARTASVQPPISVSGGSSQMLAFHALIVAVKPQDLQGLLDSVKSTRSTVISIAAGITTSRLESALPFARVIRVMPNLAIRVGKGMSCLSRGASAKPEDMELAQDIFKKLGSVLVVKEDMVNAATAVSGSGPGFFFEMVEGKSVHEARMYGRHVFLPELSSAARAVGFAPAQASLLSEATVEGSIALLKETGQGPAQLRDAVTSKGGTTEAGLKVLRETGSVTDAVRAAAIRAAELSKHSVSGGDRK